MLVEMPRSYVAGAIKHGNTAEGDPPAHGRIRLRDGARKIIRTLKPLYVV